MAINYRKKNWIEGQTFDPDTMNYLDGGIQQACDGVDALANVPTDLARNGLGAESGGKNLWDEQWELGGINSSGVKTIETDRIRSINKIKVTPNTIYTTVTQGITMVVHFYTANGDYISAVDSANRFTTPANCQYVAFRMSTSYGTTYKHDIAIIEGTSGAYEPYYSSNKMLTDDANEIASLKFLGWTVPREMPIKNYVDSQGKFHQRVARVDLGSLSWTYYSANTHFACSLPTMKNQTINVYCNKYANGTVIGDVLYDGVDKTISTRSYHLSGNEVNVKDSSYTDVSTFKTAMNGVYLYYELATEVVIAEGNENIICEKPIKYLFGRYSLRDSATAKTKFLELPVGLTIIYDNAGGEGIFIFVKSTMNLGTITYWSYDNAHSYRLRCMNGNWQSTDWEQV